MIIFLTRLYYQVIMETITFGGFSDNPVIVLPTYGEAIFKANSIPSHVVTLDTSKVCRAVFQQDAIPPTLENLIIRGVDPYSIYPSTLKRLFIMENISKLPPDVDCYVHENRTRFLTNHMPHKIFSEKNIGEPIQVGDKLFYWRTLPADPEKVNKALLANKIARDELLTALATLQKQEDVLRSYLI